jgi:cobalt-zinc-cadmium efflux system protein
MWLLIYNYHVMSSQAGLHTDQHDRSSEKRARGAGGSLRAALIITSSVLVIEFVGAIYSNSLALLADAGHMLTDVAALSLSFFALWFSTKPATPKKTYGFYRVEILAALLNGVFLLLVALYVLYKAYGRLLDPPDVRGELMLLVASGGLIANLASAYILFGKQSESLNVRGAFFHVLSDALGSVGAIVASLLIIFFGWNSADAVVSAVVAILILSSSWILIRGAVDILLEGAPAHINLVTLKDHLTAADGIQSVHDLHVWTLTSGVVAMSCHVIVGDCTDLGSDVVGRIRRIAHDRFRIDHTTIQVESENLDQQGVESCDCHFGAV